MDPGLGCGAGFGIGFGLGCGDGAGVGFGFGLVGSGFDGLGFCIMPGRLHRRCQQASWKPDARKGQAGSGELEAGICLVYQRAASATCRLDRTQNSVPDFTQLSIAVASSAPTAWK